MFAETFPSLLQSRPGKNGTGAFAAVPGQLKKKHAAFRAVLRWFLWPEPPAGSGDLGAHARTLALLAAFCFAHPRVTARTTH